MRGPGSIDAHGIRWLEEKGCCLVGGILAGGIGRQEEAAAKRKLEVLAELGHPRARAMLEEARQQEAAPALPFLAGSKLNIYKKSLAKFEKQELSVMAALGDHGATEALGQIERAEEPGSITDPWVPRKAIFDMEGFIDEKFTQITGVGPSIGA